jgi:hypothetical protein
MVLDGAVSYIFIVTGNQMFINITCNKHLVSTLPEGALMVEVCTGTMAPNNDQQYGCQTGNNLKEK